MAVISYKISDVSCDSVSEEDSRGAVSIPRAADAGRIRKQQHGIQ